MLKSRVIAIGCVLAATLSACGGSGSSKPSSSGSPTTKGAGSGSPGSSSSGKTAPDALVLAKVVTSANLKHVQDNGGFAAQNGFQSMATLSTAHAQVTATLYSYDSVADADSGYSLFIPSTNVPPVALPGIGDKAISLTDEIIVRKGAQVLQLSLRPGKLVEDLQEQAKENGTNNDAAIKAAEAVTQREFIAVVKTIAAKLTGDTGSTDLTYLPPGALDPCGFDPATLDNGDIKVTSAPSYSEDPPASQCTYTYTGTKPGEPGTGQLAVETLTTAQGAAASPSTSPAAEYASTLKAYTSRGGYPTASGGPPPKPYGTVTSGPVSVAGMKTGEVDLAMLLGPTDAASTDPGLLIRIFEVRSSYVVDAMHCTDEIMDVYNKMVYGAAKTGKDLFALIDDPAVSATRDSVAKKVAEWCADQEQTDERLPEGPDGLGGG